MSETFSWSFSEVSPDPPTMQAVQESWKGLGDRHVIGCCYPNSVRNSRSRHRLGAAAAGTRTASVQPPMSSSLQGAGAVAEVIGPPVGPAS